MSNVASFNLVVMKGDDGFEYIVIFFNKFISIITFSSPNSYTIMKTLNK
jgi:hypothetical protein